MNKFTILFLFLLYATAAFSQQSDPALSLIKQEYLSKSKRQKTVAWILIGGGSFMTILGIALPKGNSEFSPYCNCEIGQKEGAKGGFIAVGILTAGVSIPLFIASKKNKRESMSMSFKFQQWPQPQNGSLVNSRVPSLAFKISL